MSRPTRNAKKSIGQRSPAPRRQRRRTLSLRSLPNVTARITTTYLANLADAAAVCLDYHRHPQTTTLTVLGASEPDYGLTSFPVTPAMSQTWNDFQYAVEHGAYGIALLLLKETHGLVAVERSRKGTGFDFWMGTNTDPLFQDKAFLEVSGILSGDRSRVSNRRNEKFIQVGQTSYPSKGFIVIVEFGNPIAEITQR